jgi:hypothetical protein
MLPHTIVDSTAKGAIGKRINAPIVALHQIGRTDDAALTERADLTGRTNVSACAAIGIIGGNRRAEVNATRIRAHGLGIPTMPVFDGHDKLGLFAAGHGKKDQCRVRPCQMALDPSQFESLVSHGIFLRSYWLRGC